MTLASFIPLIFLCTPQKHQKTSGFLIFLGNIERGQWHEMVKSRQLEIKF